MGAGVFCLQGGAWCGCCWEVGGAGAYWSEVDAAAAPQFLRAYRK